MRTNRGFTEVALLIYVIAGLALLFVPNPVSNLVGVGVRPNKTIYTEKVEFIKDKDGNPIATKTTVSDKDIQQRVGFMDWLKSLPALVVILMGLGIVFPPVSLFLGSIYRGLQSKTKQIVVGVDRAMDAMTDPNVKKVIYDEMSKTQDTNTKSLVDKIQGKK